MKINNKNLVIGAGTVILLLAFILFGVTGLVTLVAMFLFLFLPAYLIIDLFDFRIEEKVFFSFCIGLGLFPLFVWYINRVIPSLGASLIVAFVLVLAVGIYLRFKKKR